jgi:tRNA(fMet)-specific endonuclease VapC
VVALVTFMLDTNMVSYILRGQSPRARHRMLNLQGEEEVCISSITEAEVRYGLAKRPIRAELRREIERFLDTIEVRFWDTAAAKEYGTMRAALEAAGTTLGNLDLLIAAHAASLNSVLVTSDRAFARAGPLLTVADWADDMPHRP